MLPTFMPVATQAAIKGLTSEQVESLGVTLILNNTYHLNLRPGMQTLQAAGGAHKFQGWTKNLLTVCVPKTEDVRTSPSLRTGQRRVSTGFSKQVHHHHRGRRFISKPIQGW